MEKQIGMRIDEDLIKKVKQHALDNDSTMKEIITNSLELFLSFHDKQQQGKKLNKLLQILDRPKQGDYFPASEIIQAMIEVKK